MSSDTQHLFMCLLVICISSFKKCRFMSFAQLLFQLFFKHCCRCCMCPLYILDLSLLSDTSFANIFSCCSFAQPCLILCDPMDCSTPGLPDSMGCLFTFFVVSLDVQRVFFILIKSNLPIFCCLCF